LLEVLGVHVDVKVIRASAKFAKNALHPIVLVDVVEMLRSVFAKSAINVQKVVASVDAILAKYAVVAQNVAKMDVNVVVMEIHQNVYVA